MSGSLQLRQRLAAATLVLTLVMLAVWIHLPPGADPASQVRPHYVLPRSVPDLVSSFQPLGETPLPDAVMCSLLDPGRPVPANLSTWDLYSQTQFNVRSDMEWEMPPPSLAYRDSQQPTKLLKVMLVPHSHNDPGWLKTVNDYYADQTKHILNNMVDKLTTYSNMTFIWTETVFLSMWWNEIEDDVKAQVRRLLRRGQLEITLGGWVMPDEASSHYQALLDQLTEGHQWLWEHLAVRPRTSWSIDPFGYSGTLPYLWRKSGMVNMVIQRVHQAVKASLVEHQALEFYWRQLWDDRGSTDVFCHVMPFMLYNIKYSCGPSTFACLHFDFRRVEGEVSDSRAEEITDTNLETMAQTLYHQYRAKASYFRYDVILVPIGDDFRYDKGEEWEQQYRNYERLMKYMNARPDWKVQVQWGTLSHYFQEVQKQQSLQAVTGPGQNVPVLTGDFFPYSDKDMAYWTGYYTTRPFDKILARQVQSTLQAADVLNTLLYVFQKRWGKNPETEFSELSSVLQQARRTLGLFMHHDAITGTSKSFVVHEYETNLHKALCQSQEVAKVILQSLLSEGLTDSSLLLQPESIRKGHADLSEKQVIPVEEEGTLVVLFNPSGHSRQQVVHLLVNTNVLEVVSSQHQTISAQVETITSFPKDEPVRVVYQLTFVADMGPFAVSSYLLYRKHKWPQTLLKSATDIRHTFLHQDSPFPIPRLEDFQIKNPEPVVIDNGVIQLTFDSATGSLLHLVDLNSGKKTALNLSFLTYRSQGSGAYLFSPKGPAEHFLQGTARLHVTRGPLSSRVEVNLAPFLTQVVTLYTQPPQLASSVFLETRHNIQSLPNRELILRLDSRIRNSDLSFFTDQNGFQLIRRRTNPELAVQANYYPVSSALTLEDDRTRLTLLTGQPHGAACLRPGQLELMLDRHLLYDDGRGMGEGVTDVKPIVSQFILLVEEMTHRQTGSSSPHFNALSLTALHLSDTLQHPVLSYFSPGHSRQLPRDLLPMPQSLPCDVCVASLRGLVTHDFQYNGTSLVLHRRGYHCGLLAPVPSSCSLSHSGFNLGSIFGNMSLSRLRETSLTHTEHIRTLHPQEPLLIPPMELRAFHFHL